MFQTDDALYKEASQTRDLFVTRELATVARLA
jgi:hypothetical protein